jgi:beta-glucosidase
MAGCGINWTFAPTVAAARNIRWGRTYECFSETPDLAGSMGTAATLGLQDGTLGTSPTSVLACAKHFAGDGATDGGVNAGNTTLDEATFRQLCVDQYRPLVAAGVGSVMASYNSFNGVELHGHQYLLTDVLKNELGFQGFVISDWAGIDAVGVAEGINAGLDMVMIPPYDDWAGFIGTLRGEVNGGGVPQSRVDDAVRRILTIKCEMGLFEPTYTGMVDRSLTSQVGSAAHRAVAREAVSKSIVMLQNDNDVLPLSKAARIHVAGSSADSGDNQCGGWCVNWQGDGSRAVETTVLQGIQAAMTTGTVTYSADASGAGGNDAVVVVIGETPYAEGNGDSDDLSLSAAHLTTLNNAASAGIPVVVVLITGRPVIITDQLAQADAWLAAWLPGTEGDGVADVLFGDYAPTATLTFTWPRDMGQIPISVGDTPYDPLFPFGHGLSY